MSVALNILECAVIIDMFEADDDAMQGSEIDFHAAANAMRDDVAVVHGQRFVESQTAVFMEKWMTVPDDPGLVSLLRNCRSYGVARGLPM